MLMRLGYDCRYHAREQWYTYQVDVMSIDRIDFSLKTRASIYEDRLLD